MTIDDDIAVLEQVPMLRALGRGPLRLIALGAEAREIAPGEVLFRPGERVDSAYVVQDGAFQLSADPEKPGPTLDAGPGTMLGEFAILAESAKPLCAKAMVASTVIRIPRSMFLKILEDDAGAAMRLRDYVAQRTRESIAGVLEVRYTLDPEDQS
jgi:CRP-like cAMP-binding protein